MTPENAAALAGSVWLDSGVVRPPSENDLADVAGRLGEATDGLGLVRACVPVAEAVAWVLACRKMTSEHPELAPETDVPVW